MKQHEEYRSKQCQLFSGHDISQSTIHYSLYVQKKVRYIKRSSKQEERFLCTSPEL